VTSIGTAAAEPWAPDFLGDGYEQRTLPLPDDDEGAVVATIVRYRPPSAEPQRAARAVLYIHGWSDYFFQTELAEYWHSQQVAFYAIDLRKYGRSLRDYQTPCYVEHLRTYDQDIAAALAVIKADLGRNARIMMMGHSTGGLIAALWAHRHPGRLAGLVLNSPWLELQGAAVVRHVSSPAVNQLARFSPKTALPNIDPGFSSRTLRLADGGEWTYDEALRPTPAFPVRAGWLASIIEGHAYVARGLRITAPVLAMASARSIISPRWSDDMRKADVVLDVATISQRAVQLGPIVTVVRITDGLHDLVLSAPPVRAQVYAEITRWSGAYGWT